MNGQLIHLIGVSGTGMGALAGLLLEKGFEVQGSDTAFYPPMGPFLRSIGVRLFEGYSPSNLEPRPDLVIIGNVIRRDNPEARAVMRLGLPYLSFPDALREFWLKERDVIAICGTHGKTTTTSLCVSALKDKRPGYLVGGILKDTGKGFSQGEPPWFVIEGDEYDTAFFDKTPKFLHYDPRYVVLTSVEFDHADIYPDLEAVKRVFRKLVASMPPTGIIAACMDGGCVEEVLDQAPCKVVTYGTGPSSLYRLDGVEIDGDLTLFRFTARGKHVEGKIRLPGRHNALNALGVYALLREIGLEHSEILRGLRECQGVKRRQEVVAEANGITVIDDFAHHPTAVRETLSALRMRYGPGRRMIVAFEPRTNTSRRSVFQGAYPKALSQGDLVLVRDVPDPEKAPEGDRFSSSRLVEDLRALGTSAVLFKDGREIFDFLCQEMEEGDLVVVMSNGGFEGLVGSLADYLRT